MRWKVGSEKNYFCKRVHNKFAFFTFLCYMLHISCEAAYFLKNVTLPLFFGSSIKILTLGLLAQGDGECENVRHFAKDVPKYSIDGFNCTKQIVTKVLRLEKSARSFTKRISSCPVVFIDLNNFTGVICPEVFDSVIT